MIKHDLIKELSERCETTMKNVTKFMNAYSDIILEELNKGDDRTVPLFDIGVFKVKKIPPKKGLIMLGDRKGEEWTKPARKEMNLVIKKSVKTLGE